MRIHDEDFFSFRFQAIPDAGQLFLFGQNKKTGEANMYPKPVQDLAGEFKNLPSC